MQKCDTRQGVLHAKGIVRQEGKLRGSPTRGTTRPWFQPQSLHHPEPLPLFLNTPRESLWLGTEVAREAPTPLSPQRQCRARAAGAS